MLLSSAGSVAGTGTIRFDFYYADLSSIERLRLNSKLNDIDVDFHFLKFAPTQFSLNLEFAGGAGKDTVNIKLDSQTSLDLRGATFTNWSAEDQLTIYSGGDNCTVNGTRRGDEIWEGGAYNLLNGHGGDDLFVIDSVPTMASTINGGSGWDTVVLRGSTSLTFTTQLANLEEFRFECTEPFLGQFFDSGAFEVGAANPFWHFVNADLVRNTVIIYMEKAGLPDPYFSAAGFTFENWAAGDRIAILGNPTSDRIIGSAVGDFINAGESADVLTGGMGNDTFSFESLSDNGVGVGQRDIILDFSDGDLIDFYSLALGTGLPTLAFDTDGIFTAGEFRLRGAVNTVIELYLDADAEVDMEIVLRGVTPGSLSADDFLLHDWIS